MPRSTAISGVERPLVSGIQFTDELCRALNGNLDVLAQRDSLTIFRFTPLALAKLAIEGGVFLGDGYGRFLFEYVVPIYDDDIQLYVTLRIKNSVASLGGFTPYLLALDDKADHVEIGIDAVTGESQFVTVNSDRIYIDHTSEQDVACSLIREHFTSLPSIGSRVVVIGDVESDKLS